MSSPKQLFINRLKGEWLFNYKVFKTAIDWLIGIYIIVPLLLIGFYNYFSLWDASYDLEFFSLYITVYTALYLYTWTGDVRSYIEYGDQLYLRQKEDWINKLLKMGVVHSLINSIIATVIVFLLLAPFLKVYLKLSFFEFIVLFFFIYILRLVQMYLKQFISLYFEGWKRILVSLIIIAINFSIYGFLIFYLNQTIELILIAVLALIILFYLLHQKKLSIKWSFYNDCVREQNQKIKYARYLLKVSSYFDGPVIKNKNRKNKPWIFRNSTIIFKKRNLLNGLIELYVKIILRNMGNVLALVQITGVFIYGITLTENLLKFGVWIFFILTMLKYLKDLWYVSEQNLFLKFYPVKANLRIKAAQLSILYISSPTILLTSFITGYQLFSFYLGIILMGIGIVISYFAVKVLIK